VGPPQAPRRPLRGGAAFIDRAGAGRWRRPLHRRRARRRLVLPLLAPAPL